MAISEKLRASRAMYSNAETITDAAEDIRIAANLCGNLRLTAIAYELDDIAATLRSFALAEANDATH